MPSPIAQAGAQTSPTRYAALTQGGRDITGLVTQRSPYRDGAVPYQVAKFYSGSRFDTMIDGINREVTNKLTDRRRRGHSVFNANTFPALKSFYSWSFIQNAAEIVRTIVDGADGAIYDATPGQKTSLFTKGAGAGDARFLGVNTQLFFSDGVETKKIMRSGKIWAANTAFSVGNFIVDPNGNIQSIQSTPYTYNITTTAVIADPLNNPGLTYLVVTLSAPAPTVPANRTVFFSGLTTHPEFNGVTLEWQGLTDRVVSQLLNLQPNQIAFQSTHLPYAVAADTGTALAQTALKGTTGNVQPVWPTVWGTVTNDGGNNGGVNWTCFGPAVQNWGVQTLDAANPNYSGTNPVVAPRDFVNYWRPNLEILHSTGGVPTYYAIVDPNGSIQVANNPQLIFAIFGGQLPPSWATVIGGITFDGSLQWVNYGILAPWYATTDYGGATTGVSNPCVILDTNGNLQVVQDVTVAHTSGAAAPVWGVNKGDVTVDGAISWINVGFGSVLWSGVYQYAWSAHCIDGSVSTATPITLVGNGGLGPNGAFNLLLTADITGTAAQLDKQVDQIYLWRTAQGKSSLLLLDKIPNPWLSGQTSFEYRDTFDDLALNTEIPAPIASSNNPPSANMTGYAYHLQRAWYIVDNKVGWSGGPDTLTGNGLTAFPPLNFFAYIGRPIALKPVTVENGGMLVFTTRGVYIILGTGTANNPFYSTTYYNKVSVLSPNAIELYDNRVFLMEANRKVSTLAIQYPFDPQSGYNEIGFPIGDQFKQVTTGGINAPLYDPATAYLSWNTEDTSETGMYVADGQVGWFRLGVTMPPEQGVSWSPRAALALGTSAVQAIETSPGRSQLLIGPPAGTPGPILCRDATGTVWDDNGTPFPAWDHRGATLLCSTGQWAEVAHIAAKSAAVGKRPTLSVLFNEIAATSERPFDVLKLAQKSNDPPLSPASKTVFSDRYVLAQNGKEMTGDCLITRFDYGTQAVADELLDWGAFAAVHNEQVEEAAKVGA